MKIVSAAALVMITAVARPLYAVTCGTAAGAHVQAQGPDDESVAVVDYDRQNKQLRVSARRVAFNKLLSAITDASGIEFSGETERGCEPVNIQFEYLALDHALQQVLRGRSYVLSENPDGVLIVWLLPDGDAERLTEIDPALEAFYSALTGSPQAEELARQIRQIPPAP